MWTYDGILIHKEGNVYKVFSSDEVTFRVFTLKNGELNPFFINQIKDRFKEKGDGLYQAWVGYGQVNSNQDPGIYFIKKLCYIDWHVFGGKEKKKLRQTTLDEFGEI